MPPDETGNDANPRRIELPRLEPLIGKPLEEAESAAAERGLTLRIIEEDGEIIPLGRPVSPDDLPVAVEGSVVVRVFRR